MIHAITGIGPRTGTSWVMEQLSDAGLPVYWSKGLHITGAGYETYPGELPRLNHRIVKVWPNSLSRADVQKMLVLRRNRKDQVRSIQEQMNRERIEGFTFHQTPEQMIDRAEWIVQQSKMERLEVRTEELNDRINEIVDWLSVPFEQVRIA